MINGIFTRIRTVNIGSAPGSIGSISITKRSLVVIQSESNNSSNINHNIYWGSSSFLTNYFYQGANDILDTVKIVPAGQTITGTKDGGPSLTVTILELE